jgi:hypothetical protein
MHVVATPMVIELPVGEPAQIAVAITNTSALIDAYDVDAFGLDPAWVTVAPTRLSLFPSEVGVVEITVRLPGDVPAGARTIAVHVRSENDRNEFSLAQVDLAVGARARTSLRVDPVMVTGGSRATFQLIVANDGNATVEERPMGEDPEDLLEIAFDPPVVVLAPGRRDIVRADVEGGRPWFGQPKARALTFGLGEGSPPVMATFVQRPRIRRWMLSLLGLLTAAAIFAVVLSTVADSLVDESSVDPALLNRALMQGGTGAGGMASVTPITMTGKVVVASTGEGVAGVTADLFGAGNGTVPVASAASDDSGTFAFGRLPNGRYRLRVRGAGFAEQWYQESLTFADATDIDVEDESVELDDIEIGGRPGSIEGEVVAPDPTGAVAKLVVRGVADPDGNALVDEATVSADGTFQFVDVPSPGNYQLIVDKPGFATQTRDIRLGAAEELDGITVVLREGDGAISGRVSSPGGPLGGVAIVATSGDLEFPTVSLTLDDVGAFTVRTLPTPGTYTLTFQRDGYEPATRTVTLGAAQQLGDIAVTLAPTTGSIDGTVSSAAGGLGGVTVAVTGAGDVDMRTTSVSVGTVGAYGFGGLPVPATYTLTFSRAGYVTQSRLVELGGATAPSAATGIDVQLVSSTAVIRGVIRGAGGQPVSGATVILSDGAVALQVLSADDPLGRFEFRDVAPGSYTLTASLTGTSPAVRLVTVFANEVRELDVQLEPQASLSGLVLRVDNGIETPYVGAVVRLYPPAAFPGPPTSAIAQTVVGADGRYTFTQLEAPADFVVAVYNAATASDALDSRLVQSQPSAAAEVPVIRIVFSAPPPETIPTTTAPPTPTTAPPTPTTVGPPDTGPVAAVTP